MTAPIRVLIVDDAVIVRRLISSALGQEPGFEVVGSASDGEMALERIEALGPDVVTLDIDMPGMNGITALRTIRDRWPRLPVVMFTGVERPGPEQLEALAIGARDCVAKLPHEGNMVNAIEWTRTHLAPRLRALVQSTPPDVAPVVPRLRTAPASPPEILVIGASAGGPDAVGRLLSRLPADLPLPVLVAVHMPNGFTRLLAERLQRQTPFPVAEAVPGEPLEAGQVRVAPGDRHMVVLRDREGAVVGLNQDPPENFCRPSVDVLFRSAARAFGAGTVAVVLTGMGQDGLLGAESIARAGGQVLVQDEASSVVWGMPGAVARAGYATGMAPVEALAERIVQLTRGRALASPV